LPEGAQFCLDCGKPVSVAPKIPPQKETAVDPHAVEIIPPLPPRRPPRRRVFLWVVLAVVVAVVVWIGASDNPYAQGVQELVGWKHDQTVLDAPFSVGPHTFRYYKFNLPEGSVNVAIVGEFKAVNEANKNSRGESNGDSNKDSTDGESGIEAYVLSDAAFTVWQNGYATSAVYESGRVSEGKVQADLPAGAGVYYLVFSNKFAPKTAKSVNASVLLRYKSWLPESFRKMKERLLNWLGL
jgi:hypothetical protein